MLLWPHYLEYVSTNVQLRLCNSYRQPQIQRNISNKSKLLITHINRRHAITHCNAHFLCTSDISLDLFHKEQKKINKHADSNYEIAACMHVTTCLESSITIWRARVLLVIYTHLWYLLGCFNFAFKLTVEGVSQWVELISHNFTLLQPNAIISIWTKHNTR